MGILTMSQAADLYNPAMQAIFNKNLDARENEYKEFFYLDKTDLYQYQESAFSGLPAAEIKREGIEVNYQVPVQGYDKTYTQVVYANGFKATMEIWKFDRFAQLKKMPKALALSVEQTRHVNLFNHFNRAFSGSYTGPDAVALCSTAHPITGAGGTQRNRPSTDVDLSYTGVQQAIMDMDILVNDYGYPLKVTPKKLLVYPTKKMKALEILRSVGNPTNANNVANVVTLSSDLKLVTGHWLSSSTPGYWFLTGDVQDDCLKVCRAQEAEMESGSDFDTKDLKWTVTFMEASGWTLWYNVWGSAGA